MKRLLVYLVLLMHVNTYMFFPMVDETDAYEKSGKQKDDINSLAEYIYQVLLGHRDSTPEDEDDDQAHFYQLKSGISYSIVTACVIRDENPVIPAPEGNLHNASGPAPALRLVSYDVQAPPPDQLYV